MPITKKEQMEQRRTRVWELYSQGMTQERICDELKPFHVSRRTIGNDILWLKKDAANFVRDNRKNIAEEYRKVMSNLEQLRREAWSQFRQTKNESVKTNLYDVIESINYSILNLLSVGDMIELELLKRVREEVEEAREEMVMSSIAVGGNNNNNGR